MLEIQARVADLTDRGSGVVEAGGRVYFVDDVLPGELIEFLPGKKHKGKSRGSVQRILEFSEDRAEPECGYFGVCGGCVLQHLGERGQRHHKEKILFDALAGAGNVTVENKLPMIRSPASHYRRKARLGVKLVPKKGGILVGFRERRRSFIASIKDCKTLDDRISKLLPAFHDLISKLDNNDRIPQIEVAAGDNDIAMILRHLEALSSNDESLLREFSRRHDIHVWVQPGGMETVRPLHPPKPNPIHYVLDEFGVTLAFSPSDFVQVNGVVNENLVSMAIEHLDLKKSDNVLDLFCGIGNFTLAISKCAGSVLGVEGEKSLADKGVKNALLNNIGNVEFKCWDLFADGVEMAAKGKKFNKVLLDPPRSGAYKVVTRLIPELCPEKIVYVSCNPATLARDADELVNNSKYSVTHAGAIDMFPHTAHVESIAVFEYRR